MTTNVFLLTAALLGGCTEARTATPPPPMPPPAKIQVDGRVAQLAYGSYRWAGGVANYGPPSRRTDVPRIVARRGRVALFRLRFDPDRVTVRTGGRSAADLRPDRVARWQVTRGGLLVLRAELGQSHATYLARLVVR